MKKTILVLFLIFMPMLSQGATLGSFTSGIKSCYQYGVDLPPFEVTFGGTASLTQAQVQFSSGYTPNGGLLRYVGAGGTSPIHGTLNWSNAFDGVTARPWVATQIRFYSTTDGFSAYTPASFIVQDTICPTNSATTTEATLMSIAFGQGVLIVILSLGFVAMWYNSMTKKKPWQK